MISTQNTESNYLATVAVLGDPIPHPNADRLQMFSVEHNLVITDLGYQKGDVVVYFPIECAIDPTILSELNMFDDASMNIDKKTRGYINKRGRVRAVRLRGEPSMGLVIRLSALEKILGKLPTVPQSGVEFDTWGDKLICWKYVPPRPAQGQGGKERRKSTRKIEDQIVDGQFRFHYSTPHLKRNLHHVEGDVIITKKLHGTSCVFGNLLCHRQMPWYQRVINKVLPLQTTEYGPVTSSRKVIKDVNGSRKSTGGFYGKDLWTDAHQQIADKIEKGITLYGEIVGYTGDKMIQKGYDYGCKPGESKLFVYRITMTDADGQVFEFNWDMIEEYCQRVGLEPVPVIFKGSVERLVEDWRTTLELPESLGEAFLDGLYKSGVTREGENCDLCVNPVPAEGVCLRFGQDIFKAKNFSFLEHESKELDTAEEILD